MSAPLYAQEFVLPQPGTRVSLSPAFNPALLKGIKVHPNDPLRFDFILDPGQGVIASEAKQSQEQLKNESRKLIKYFLAALTTPEEDLWVNLSPYEKDRIVPKSFGTTEMGRDLLAQDYMLKQVTASLIYPEDEIGRKFWKRIYDEAAKRFGTTNVPVNTFNKVWVVPEKAVVYENVKAGTAYVVESKLKVMLEQDYLALNKKSSSPIAVVGDPALRQWDKLVTPEVSTMGSQVVREVVIPELEKEVNSGKNFTQLRQVYNSLILAAWYKKKIKDSILSQVYASKNKVAGLTTLRGSEAPEAIYQRYLEAFKKGAYNYIKEEQDPLTKQTIPRKYFSGGAKLGNLGEMIKYTDKAMLPEVKDELTIETTLKHKDYAMLGQAAKVAQFLGGRKNQEDVVMDIPNFELKGDFDPTLAARLHNIPNRSGHLLVVLDGHSRSGESAKNITDIIRENLGIIFSQQLINYQGNVENALKGTFMRLNALTRSSKSGTTATIVYVPTDSLFLYYAVLGDSPFGVLRQDGTFVMGPIQTLESDRERVQKYFQRNSGYADALGIFVRNDAGESKSSRVPRAFGSSELGAVITKVPDLGHIDIQVGDKIIMGSDGLVFDHDTKESMERVAEQIYNGRGVDEVINDPLNKNDDNRSLMVLDIDQAMTFQGRIIPGKDLVGLSSLRVFGDALIKPGVRDFMVFARLALTGAWEKFPADRVRDTMDHVDELADMPLVKDVDQLKIMIGEFVTGLHEEIANNNAVRPDELDTAILRFELYLQWQVMRLYQGDLKEFESQYKQLLEEFISQFNAYQNTYYIYYAPNSLHSERSIILYTEEMGRQFTGFKIHTLRPLTILHGGDKAHGFMGMVPPHAHNYGFVFADVVEDLTGIVVESVKRTPELEYLNLDYTLRIPMTPEGKSWLLRWMPEAKNMMSADGFFQVPAHIEFAHGSLHEFKDTFFKIRKALITKGIEASGNNREVMTKNFETFTAIYEAEHVRRKIKGLMPKGKMKEDEKYLEEKLAELASGYDLENPWFLLSHIVDMAIEGHPYALEILASFAGESAGDIPAILNWLEDDLLLMPAGEVQSLFQREYARLRNELGDLAMLTKKVNISPISLVNQRIEHSALNGTVGPAKLVSDSPVGKDNRRIVLDINSSNGQRMFKTEITFDNKGITGFNIVLSDFEQQRFKEMKSHDKQQIFKTLLLAAKDIFEQEFPGHFPDFFRTDRVSTGSADFLQNIFAPYMSQGFQIVDPGEYGLFNISLSRNFWVKLEMEQAFNNLLSRLEKSSDPEAVRRPIKAINIDQVTFEEPDNSHLRISAELYGQAAQSADIVSLGGTQITVDLNRGVITVFAIKGPGITAAATGAQAKHIASTLVIVVNEALRNMGIINGDLNGMDLPPLVKPESSESFFKGLAELWGGQFRIDGRAYLTGIKMELVYDSLGIPRPQDLGNPAMISTTVDSVEIRGSAVPSNVSDDIQTIKTIFADRLLQIRNSNAEVFKNFPIHSITLKELRYLGPRIQIYADVFGEDLSQRLGRVSVSVNMETRSFEVLSIDEKPLTDLAKEEVGKAMFFLFLIWAREFMQGKNVSIVKFSTPMNRLKNGGGFLQAMAEAINGKENHGFVADGSRGIYEFPIHNWENVYRLLGLNPDAAMFTLNREDSSVGGIDLTANKTPLDIKRSEAGEIKLKMDPARLKELQDADGFEPIIINIQPLRDLPLFLGINDTSHSASAV